MNEKMIVEIRAKYIYNPRVLKYLASETLRRCILPSVPHSKILLQLSFIFNDVIHNYLNDI